MTYEFQPPSTAQTATVTTTATSSTEILPLGRFNALAVVAFTLTLVTPFTLAGIILGHFSLNDIKKSNERGRGLALTAIIAGYLTVAFTLLIIVAFNIFAVTMFDEFTHQFKDLTSQFSSIGE